ncbi:MAG: hypothetical protein ISR80_05160 [Nitrosopumilus sp.]|nr:hypothetical protein [Nitrosopumilus sp.]
MKDSEKVNLTPYDPTTDFIPQEFYQSVIPIIKNSGNYPENIIGTGFLIQYNGVSYIVSAKHVVESEDNPSMFFTGKGSTPIILGTDTFRGFGLDWISHPRGLDVAVMPLILPTSISQKIINNKIIQNKTIDPATIKPNVRTKHLGYGGKMTGVYKRTQKLSGTPGAAFGRYVIGNMDEITIKSPARFGDSGSPLFVKFEQKSRILVGVVTRTGTRVKITNVEDGEYTGETKAIPIQHVLDIINSKSTQEKIKNANKKINDMTPKWD